MKIAHKLMKSVGISVLYIIFGLSITLYADDPEGHVIQFSGTSYSPDQLDVAVSDTIIWQGSFSSHPLESTSVPEGADEWGLINSGTEYRYVVEVEGTYEYHCTVHSGVGMTGSFSATVTSVDENISGNYPSSYRLEQNYPNPFNPSTVIKYGIPERSHVELTVYNILGKEVATLVNDDHASGLYEVTFNATGLASGIYIYRLEAGEHVEMRRMLYLK